MRIDNVQYLGLYVRDQRQELGLTQTDLCAAAKVSRRWLSDLEAGKATAEVGLVLRVLHALGLTLEANRYAPTPVDIALDERLRGYAAVPPPIDDARG